MALSDNVMEATGGIMADERRALIMQIIESAGRVRVQELAQRFSTTSVTIRNDLNELQKRDRDSGSRN